MQNLILKETIKTASAWLGKDLKHDQRWQYVFSEHDLATFDQLVRQLEQKGLAAPDFTQEDFVIQDPALLLLIGKWVNELEHGFGFCVLKGLSLERYTEAELANIYYGLGLYMGLPVTQNPRGDLLGVVANVGDKTQKTTRTYETNSYLPYHTDLSDVVGLLCIRKAKEGGLSSLVSASMVYNHILEHYPEYLGYYYYPTYCDHLGDDQPTLTPIFSYHQNKLSCRYLRAYIELGHERKNVPLAEVEKQALDIFDGFIHHPDFRLDMMLEPGDIQFCNNYVVMHSRTGFEDYDELEQRRKLLRLWLKMPNARELAPDFPGRNGIAKKIEVAA
ncbi:TauD/TfdA family dioxygenase [Acinetobacter sp. MB5]|uniref:TauD/TfdA family dioxygenase n=1 Tax=Acinetobacter sp. MB5 TaxID=2069438 RepID=UPI000DCFC6A8|nr:TauD/TfdA family dioxygenase [Acinetobacter sp. MB5]